MLSNLMTFLGSPPREPRRTADEDGTVRPLSPPPSTSARSKQTPASQGRSKKTAVLSVGVPLEEAFGQPTTSHDTELFVFGSNALRLAAPPKRPPRPKNQLVASAGVEDHPLVFVRARPKVNSTSPTAVQPLAVHPGGSLSARGGSTRNSDDLLLAKPPARSTYVKGKRIVLDSGDNEDDGTKSTSPASSGRQSTSPPRQGEIEEDKRKQRVIQETLQRMRHNDMELAPHSSEDVIPLARPPPRISPNEKKVSTGAEDTGELKFKRSSPSKPGSPELKVSRPRRLSELPPSSRASLSSQQQKPVKQSQKDVDPLSPFIVRRQKKAITSPTKQRKGSLLAASAIVKENVAKFSPPNQDDKSPSSSKQVIQENVAVLMPSMVANDGSPEKLNEQESPSATNRRRSKQKPLYLEPSTTNPLSPSESPSLSAGTMISDPILLKLHRHSLGGAHVSSPKSPFEAMKKRMELASGGPSRGKDKSISSSRLVPAMEPLLEMKEASSVNSSPPVDPVEIKTALPEHTEGSNVLLSPSVTSSSFDTEESKPKPISSSSAMETPKSSSIENTQAQEIRIRGISAAVVASSSATAIPLPMPPTRTPPRADSASSSSSSKGSSATSPLKSDLSSTSRLPAPPLINKPVPPPPPPSASASSSSSMRLSPTKRRSRRSFLESYRPTPASHEPSKASPVASAYQEVSAPSARDVPKSEGRASPPVDQDRRMDRSVTVTSAASSSTTAFPALSSTSASATATTYRKSLREPIVPDGVFKKQSVNSKRNTPIPSSSSTAGAAASPRIPRRGSPYAPPAKEEIPPPPPSKQQPTRSSSTSPAPPPPPPASKHSSAAATAATPVATPSPPPSATFKKDSMKAKGEIPLDAPSRPPKEVIDIGTRSVSTPEIRAAIDALPHLPSPQKESSSSQLKKRKTLLQSQEEEKIPAGVPAEAPTGVAKRSESERRLASRCRELVEGKRADEALEVCDEWRRLNPNSGEAWYLAGRAHLLRGDASPAEHNLNNAKNLLSSSTATEDDQDLLKLVQREANKVRTMIHARDKCLEELAKRGSSSAVSHANRATEIAPLNPQLCILKAAALLVSQSVGSSANQEEEKAARTAAGANHSGEANSDALYGQEINKAMTLAKQDLVSQIGRPALQYARVMHRAGLTSEADSLLEEICNRVPNKQALPACVELLKSFRRMESAKSDANEAYSQGKYGESIRLFTAALQLDPVNDLYNSILLSNRAASYMALGDYQRAVDDCDSALRLVPSFLRARLRRARALQKMGKFRESIADFELAMRVNPSPSIAQELADARKALKDHQEKKRTFHMRGFASFGSSSSTFSSNAPPPFEAAGSGPLPRPSQPPPGGYSSSRPRSSVHSTVVEDLYKLLGVTPQASHADIKKAYHKAALKHHPDKNQGDSEASQRFKKVLDAFHTLSDPQSRRKYDLMYAVSVPMI